MTDLAEAFSDLKTFLKMFGNMDPQSGQVFVVHYLFTSKPTMEKKKQTKQAIADMFLKGVTPAPAEPPAGPSGGLAAEGIVVRRWQR